LSQIIQHESAKSTKAISGHLFGAKEKTGYSVIIGKENKEFIRKAVNNKPKEG
jgi:hypothetical protein